VTTLQKDSRETCSGVIVVGARDACSWLLTSTTEFCASTVNCVTRVANVLFASQALARPMQNRFRSVLRLERCLLQNWCRRISVLCRSPRPSQSVPTRSTRTSTSTTTTTASPTTVARAEALPTTTTTMLACASRAPAPTRAAASRRRRRTVKLRGAHVRAHACGV
jgi:hypothetical protein